MTGMNKIIFDERNEDAERRNEISADLKAKILKYLGEWKSQTDPKVWADLAEADLIDCHFGLGMWIRNTYLWQDAEIQREFLAAGYWHVDDMSQVILEIWQEELRRETEGIE